MVRLYDKSRNFRLGSVKSFNSCTVSNHYTQRERPRRDGAASLFYVILSEAEDLLEINPVYLHVVAVRHQEVKVVNTLHAL